MAEKTHLVNVGYCELSSKLGTIARVCSFFIFLFIQLFLLFKVVKVIKEIRCAVQHTHSSTKSNGCFWLYVRCIGAQINLIIVWCPSLVRELLIIWRKESPPSLVAMCGVSTIFLSINGFIVLAGNKPLKNFLASLRAKFFAKGSLKNSMELLREASYVQKESAQV
eukprot:Phypoly_transcript_09372.p1 GENE.Phypoly_transcript_09372~~Phypoly_transcript_09372.p1  ORF type:complete len:166 (+),score=10.68 Phypoly_transcript_09372:608-1105(+)